MDGMIADFIESCIICQIFLNGKPNASIKLCNDYSMQ